MKASKRFLALTTLFGMLGIICLLSCNLFATLFWGEPTATSKPTPAQTSVRTVTPFVPTPSPIPLAADTYEPDGTYAQANEILYEADTTGTYDQQHSIYPSGEYDWVYFSAVADNTYAIETFPNMYGTSMDTVIRLYDTDGVTLLDEDDQSGQGSYSQIVWTCLTTGTYFLRVSGSFLSSQGDYILSVMQVASGLINIIIQ